MHKICWDKLDEDVKGNKDGGIRWLAPYLMLPPLDTPARQLQQAGQNDDEEMTRGKHKENAVNPKHVDVKSPFFKVKRRDGSMAWEGEFSALKEDEMGPPVDYATHAYDYPPLRSEIPNLHDKSQYPDYPPLKPLGDLMKAWPQDDDFPGAHKKPIPEGLLHFNFF